MRTHRHINDSTTEKTMAAWIAAGASVIGGLMSSEGQDDVNATNLQIAANNSAFNAEQARINREFQDTQALRQMTFQETQREDQYQTAVADMKAAGLNPMLAYAQGGAKPTSGAMAGGSQATSAQNAVMGNRALAGLQGAASAAQITNIQADTEKKDAETDLTRAQIPESQARTEYTKALKKLSDNELEEKVKTFDNRLKTLGWTTRQAEAESDIRTSQQHLESARWNFHNDVAKGERDKLIAEASAIAAEARIRHLEIPAAVNAAAMERTEFGKVKPYIDPVTKGLGAAVGAIRNLRR